MMRWKVIAVASLVTACGGAVFTTDEGGGKDGGTHTGGTGGGSSLTGGSAGTSSGGNSGTGGSSSGTGGATATGGAIGNGGVVGVGGTIASGGVVGVGGTVASGGVVGVGGTVASGGVVGVGGMTAAGGSMNDGGLVITACPPQPPATDVPCKSGLVCSYGTDSRPSCREVYTCSQSGWSIALSKCVQVPDCLNLPTSPVVGSACPTPNQYCEFSSHLTCACTPCSNTSCVSTYEWTCMPPPPSPCPTVPPDEGQPCDSVKGNQCSYAFCGVPEYVIASCSSKIWSWDFPPCAISAQ